jgi:hypothetical protein
MTTRGAPACLAATAASKAALPPPTTTTGMFSVLTFCDLQRIVNRGLHRPAHQSFIENKAWRGLGQLKNLSINSFQHGLLESRFTWTFPNASLQLWMPAIHAGMTVISVSCFVRERKIMNHFL